MVCAHLHLGHAIAMRAGKAVIAARAPACMAALGMVSVRMVCAFVKKGLVANIVRHIRVPIYVRTEVHACPRDLACASRNGAVMIAQLRNHQRQELCK